MTISQAARELHVSRTLIYRAIKEGKLRAVKGQLHQRGGILLDRAEVELLRPKPLP